MVAVVFVTVDVGVEVVLPVVEVEMTVDIGLIEVEVKGLLVIAVVVDPPVIPNHARSMVS